MTTHIKVFPTKASALNAHHPSGAKSRSEGELWPYDVFTMRRLTDGSFTEDPSKAYRDAAVSTERPSVAAKPAEPAAAPVAAKPADFANDAKPK